MPVRRRCIVRQIVREVRAVPDHDVVIVYGLTVDPLADVRLVRGTDGMHTVIDLVAMIAKDPDIAAAERRVGARGFDAVVFSRNDIVRLARSGVLDAPLAMARRIAWTRNLEAHVVPTVPPRKRRVIELAHNIVAWRAQIEIEPPVRMMVVDIADT